MTTGHREIIVVGDLAVVRVTWTLTVRKGAEETRPKRAASDVFRRQPDGRWSIARMAAVTCGRTSSLIDRARGATARTLAYRGCVG